MLTSKIEFAGINQYGFGHQTYDLSTGNTHATSSRSTAHFLKGNMQRGSFDIRNVHTHLRNAILVDKPTNGFRAFERAGNPYFIALLVFEHFTRKRIILPCLTTFLAHIEGNGHSATGRGGIEVEVHSNQEIASAYVGGSHLGYVLIESGRSKVRTTFFIVHLLRQSFVFTLSANGQVLAFGCESCSFIAVAWNALFLPHALSERARKCSAFFQTDIGYGDKRTNVERTTTRVGTMMLAHINQLLCRTSTCQCRFQHHSRRTYKSNHRTIGCLARINVQHFYSFAIHLYGCHGGYNLVDYFTVAPLAEIGHAFNNLLHKQSCVF